MSNDNVVERVKAYVAALRQQADQASISDKLNDLNDILEELDLNDLSTELADELQAQIKAVAEIASSFGEDASEYIDREVLDAIENKASNPMDGQTRDVLRDYFDDEEADDLSHETEGDLDLVGEDDDRYETGGGFPGGFHI